MSQVGSRMNMMDKQVEYVSCTMQHVEALQCEKEATHRESQACFMANLTELSTAISSVATEQQHQRQLLLELMEKLGIAVLQAKTTKPLSPGARERQCARNIEASKVS